jgi:hypothetical protein
MYAEKGLSVIPIIPGSKKPMVAWASFQKERATKDQINEWWSKNPDCNIGIVTGEISDLFVVDIDTEEGQKNLEEYGFDSIITPTVKTPRGGQHLYFKYPEGTNITIGAGKIPGTDFRGNGGFVVAPPSTNVTGKPYEWIVDLMTPRSDALPISYIKKINIYIGDVDSAESRSQQVSTLSTNDNIFTVGVRDENLFHIAHCLVKSGNSDEYIRQTRMAITKSWGEIDERWINAKIESAKKRKFSKERNLAAEIREFCLSTTGVFFDY